MKLLPHQSEVLERLSNGKILWGGVGSGKSIVALAYYIQKELIGDIYVITTAKKRDSIEWETDAAKFGISTKRDHSVAGKLTVDSWNNIGKYIDVEGAFFIFDEQRLVGNGAWVKSFHKIAKKNAWLILSATPGDTWLDYVPVFIANGYFKNVTEFKRNHVIYAPFSKYPKIERFIKTYELEQMKKNVLVEMPYMSNSERLHKDVLVYYDVDMFKQVSVDRWNPYTNEPIKDAAEMFSTMRKVVNSDYSRLYSLIDLTEKHERIIVFYNFNYELEILRELYDRLPISYEVAEWNGHKKDKIPESSNWVYLVQYSAGAEGWNCTSTDTMVFYSLTYSYKMYEQAQGRIDRLHTRFHKLYYYSFVSKSIPDLAVTKSLAQKKNFNERKWCDDNIPIFNN